MRNTIQKFNKYCELLRKKYSDDKLLMIRLSQGLNKLKQIDYIYKKTIQLQFCISYSSLFNIEKRTMQDFEFIIIADDHLPDFFSSVNEYEKLIQNKTLKDVIFELQTEVESLYYFAFNLTNICDDIIGLKKFNPKGVRDVRNHILVHPKVVYGHSWRMENGQ
jgi:hypothetical protein